LFVVFLSFFLKFFLSRCTCVSASARQSRAQCCAREFCCKILSFPIGPAMAGGGRPAARQGGLGRWSAMSERLSALSREIWICVCCRLFIGEGGRAAGQVGRSLRLRLRGCRLLCFKFLDLQPKDDRSTRVRSTRCAVADPIRTLLAGERGTPTHASAPHAPPPCPGGGRGNLLGRALASSVQLFPQQAGSTSPGAISGGFSFLQVRFCVTVTVCECVHDP